MHAGGFDLGGQRLPARGDGDAAAVRLHGRHLRPSAGLIWGLGVYTAASLLCAVAPSLPVLVLGRVLQGFGGAGIMSVNGALVRFIFPRALLGRGIGYNALIVAGSSAAGPSVAAAIMSVQSWPWLFALQVPVGVLALWSRIASCRARRAPGHPSIRSAPC